jgi:molybdate transport system substrate-binding protein
MQTGNAMPNGTVTESTTLRIFTTNSSQAILPKLLPEFERARGCTVSVNYDPGYESRARIARGEIADLYISDVATMNELAKQNKIVTGSRRGFARYGVGVAVLAGAPKPDIGSVESFRRTLLDAETIAYTEAGSSGMHFSGVIERLGIASEVKAKARTRPAAHSRTPGGPRHRFRGSVAVRTSGDDHKRNRRGCAFDTTGIGTGAA